MNKKERVCDTRKEDSIKKQWYRPVGIVFAPIILCNALRNLSNFLLNFSNCNHSKECSQFVGEVLTEWSEQTFLSFLLFVNHSGGTRCRTGGVWSPVCA